MHIRFVENFLTCFHFSASFSIKLFSDILLRLDLAQSRKIKF